MSSVTVKGGNKLKKALKDAKRNRAVSYDVGFFPKSAYDDGTKVAQVAAWNEFGTQDIPERPFFKRANIGFRKQLRKLVKRFLDPVSKTMHVRDAGKVAAVHAGAVQEKITSLRTPPNARSTIKMKGSSNPLIDTGLMRQSVTWKVNKNGS